MCAMRTYSRAIEHLNWAWNMIVNFANHSFCQWQCFNCDSNVNSLRLRLTSRQKSTQMSTVLPTLVHLFTVALSLIKWCCRLVWRGVSRMCVSIDAIERRKSSCQPPHKIHLLFCFFIVLNLNIDLCAARAKNTNCGFWFWSVCLLFDFLLASRKELVLLLSVSLLCLMLLLLLFFTVCTFFQLFVRRSVVHLFVLSFRDFCFGSTHSIFAMVFFLPWRRNSRYRKRFFFLFLLSFCFAKHFLSFFEFRFSFILSTHL